MPKRLLTILSDCRPHSGEVIAGGLGCSRTAVWKHVQALRDQGADIEAVAGQGYRLAEPLELLDADAIRAEMDSSINARLAAMELHGSLESTNDLLLSRPADRRHGVAILAERQTRGRGRRGRRWVSPFARNLYLSLGWRFERGAAELGCLPLVVALSAIDALLGSGVRNVGVKWPNDLVAGGRKLGGCLVEIQGDASGPCIAVVGIGINVRMPGSLPEAKAIDQPWTDLGACGDGVSRNRLAGRLLNELLLKLQAFEAHGFEPLRHEWEEHDVLLGNEVELVHAGGNIRGRVLGVSSSGSLRLQSSSGIGEYASGEVSVIHK